MALHVQYVKVGLFVCSFEDVNANYMYFCKMCKYCQSISTVIACPKTVQLLCPRLKLLNMLVLLKFFKLLRYSPEKVR